MSGRVHRITLLVVTALVIDGCAVGPDFIRPAPPPVATYTPKNAALTLTASGGEPSQRLVSGQAIPAAWWHLFHSRALDRLVRQVIADNLTVEAAENTLAQAQEAVLQARGAYFPQVDLAASAERQAGPSFQLGVNPTKRLPTYNIYAVGPLTSTFSPDVFGTMTRKVEQEASLAQYQAFQLAAAQLTLTGNVVTQALTIASDRAQIAAIRDIIADDEKNFALVRQKFEAGRAPRTDVLLAESQLTNDRALLPPLQQLLGVAEDALTTLASKYPARWSPPAFALRDFKLPTELPISVPSALVHQRPDILAAEAQLHAASAAVGVAIGQTYPIINLSASLETAATKPELLFENTGLGSGLVWTALGSVTAPVFHGGALEAQKQGAIDAFRASSATYQQVVVQAFGQVADALRALDHDAKLIKAERQAVSIANESLTLQRSGYDAGKVDILKLIDSQRSAQQARIGYVRAVAQRYLDTAQLLVALGGGWSEDRALCGDCRSDTGNPDTRL